MFRSEFMPLSVAAHGDLERPIMPQEAGGSGTFAAMFGEIRNEVVDFIENGSSKPHAVALSAEGGFYRAQWQAPAADTVESSAATSDAQQEFLVSIAPLAEEVSRRLGVSADIISAHAALESGWGKRPLRGPDGSDTHNLFGVKAGSGWKGNAIDAATTEYESGVALGKTERFRSFPDQASAFRDFAHLLLDNPRYRSALNTGSDARAYAQGLVRGGYATDPAYADKLVRLATRIQSRD